MNTRIIEVDPRSVKLLELNARYMRHETFALLVKNIKRDGKLTSVPFAVRDGDGWLVLSGNHRVKAAVEAGLTTIPLMVTDDELDAQQRVAIQLSHNAITGEDDQAVLRELYNQLEAVDWRDYSGLDDVALGQLGKVDLEGLSEANLDFQMLTFMFLPDEIERITETFKEARAMCQGKNVLLTKFEDYDRFLDHLDTAGRSFNVTSSALALQVILNLFERHRGDLSDGWGGYKENDKNWVPLVGLLGSDSIPLDAGRVVKQAIAKMIASGDVTAAAPWRALELWAADYLAGQ